jgi:hypothetical protein
MILINWLQIEHQKQIGATMILTDWLVIIAIILFFLASYEDEGYGD